MDNNDNERERRELLKGGTTNVYLDQQAKKLKFYNWRGVVFVDQLKFMRPKVTECGILGSQNSNSDKMNHWVCWFKHLDNIYYFDSFGLSAPSQFIRYMKTKRNKILISTFQLQNYEDSNCGQWCLYILNKLNEILRKNGKVEDDNFIDIILDLINTNTY